MRRAFIKNALDDIDSYIERDDRTEILPPVYKIETYEDYGTFRTVEEALEYAINHTHIANEEFPSDWIYKEGVE